MWTKESLREVIEKQLGDYLLIVVSNREPYMHTYKKGKITCQRSAGGVITALDPVMKTCSGLWVAHGSGDADRKTVDKGDRVKVPLRIGCCLYRAVGASLLSTPSLTSK